jgi:hypothetical protein
MASPYTAKAQTELSGLDLRDIELLGSELHEQNILIGKQAQRISRLYALTWESAIAIANLAFAGGPR